ncbi:hypothetical protein ACBY01_13540 [Sphingomonas sp. ac-8]|uniref:hypothetical protein n=1 Tax=Sphingomonas sp. ac-8 TaxID=3242977 RepID=UPI003A7F7DB7
MRVNSDETLRRAAAYRSAHAGQSWLELSRRPEQQQRSREFFSGGRPSGREPRVEAAE